MTTPNLFHYATSELSQDAFICYLLAWANPECREADLSLHKCSLDFISNLIRKSESTPPEHIDSINVHRQRFHLDILAEINGEIVLGIEDKTWTKGHGTQLKDYHVAVKNEYPGKRVCLIYLKTGNESPSGLSLYREDDFHCFGRGEFLSLLNGYNGHNAIVKDFRDRLVELEGWTNAFRDIPISQWNSWQWQGFYNELHRQYNDLEWDYVPNPAGGFMGAWWHWQPNGGLGTRFYLQFEQDKLCIKVEDGGCRVRESWKKHKLLHLINDKCAAIPKLAQHGYCFLKPARFGSGTYMTIGVLKSPETGYGIPRHVNGTVNLKMLFEVTDSLGSLVDQLGTVAV